MKEIKFPKDFWWGGALSAEQTEGSNYGIKGDSIFDYQFKTTPKDFFNGEGPGETVQIIKRYKEDIKLWKSLGLNSMRTSFSWARLFPEGDYQKPCAESVAFYHSYIDELIKNDIKPIFTLFHFDMPLIYQNIGGWESREVWDKFLEYAKFVFKEYGSKIDYWTTMNEPWVPIQAAYFNDVQYPKINDVQKGINAAYGIVMSHAKVVNYFNANMPKSKKIGAIFNSTIVYPKNKNSQEDVDAAKYMDLYQFTGLTDPMISGKWNPDLITWLKAEDKLPKNYEKNDLIELKKVKVDWIGLNYYSPARAEAPSTKSNTHFYKNYFKDYKMPGRRENKFRGWEIYPEAIYDNFKFLIERYGAHHEFMLTEFGMGVENENVFRDQEGKIDDQYRISFIKEHLVHLSRVMNDYPSVKFLGAHIWATMDCWSWGNAFKNRYGLIEVDLKTQKRIVKSSGLFYSNMIKNCGFSDNFKPMEEYIDYDILDFSESINL